MFKIPCDRCKDELILDHRATVNDYKKTMDYLINMDGVLDSNTIQTYMVYRCLGCDSLFKLTPLEVQTKIKYEMARIAMDIKQDEEFNRLSKLNLPDDTASLYCGKCRGAFNNGHCFKTIHAVCSIRKRDEI